MTYLLDTNVCILVRHTMDSVTKAGFAILIAHWVTP